MHIDVIFLMELIFIQLIFLFWFLIYFLFYQFN